MITFLSLSIIILIFISDHSQICEAVVPSAVIEVIDPLSSPQYQRFFAGIANFGPRLSFGKSKDPPKSNKAISGYLPLKLAPRNNTLLCEDVDGTSASTESFILLVPRGQCSFEKKAQNGERLGAAHVIVYDNLSTKYDVKVEPPNSLSDVLWPNSTIDYECNRGEAWIPMDELSFDILPYDSSNDGRLTGTPEDGNLCAIYHDLKASSRTSFQDTCLSERCLLTNKRDFVPSLGKEFMQACCAWDIHMDMGEDETIHGVNISSTFLTMKEGDQLAKLVQDNQNMGGDIRARVYLRWYPDFNFSSVLICILGTWVTWFAGWRSASIYRRAKSKVEVGDVGDSRSINQDELVPTRNNMVCTLHVQQDQNLSRPNHDAETSRRYPEMEEAVEQRMNPPPLPPDARVMANTSTEVPVTQEVLNLKYYHAILFVVFASVMLLILFFTKLYDVVRVFYLIGGVTSMIQVIIYPALHHIYNNLPCKSICIRPLCHFRCHFNVNMIGIFSGAFGAVLGGIWLWMTFTKLDVQMHPYYWIIQDVMGVCVCIVFLEVIRLNSIKIASVLLVAAFIYDIFFVFITPYIVGESVMITVATGGGQATSAYHCEKYPSDGDCNNTPLPMLFAIPKIKDYRGGLSMLGLGDIVLPGLICCFAARLDAAEILIATAIATRQGDNGTNERISQKQTFLQRLWNGYFYKIIIAYAIGLILANVAVYFMKQGQPALMYLVPLTLCTLIINGRIKGELGALWKGPERLQQADELVSNLQSRSGESWSVLDENTVTQS